MSHLQEQQLSKVKTTRSNWTLHCIQNGGNRGRRRKSAGNGVTDWVYFVAGSICFLLEKVFEVMRCYFVEEQLWRSVQSSKLAIAWSVLVVPSMATNGISHCLSCSSLLFTERFKQGWTSLFGCFLSPLARTLHVHRLLPRQGCHAAHQVVGVVALHLASLLLVRAISTFTCYHSRQEN